jgi:hypothetical protein
MPDVEPSGAEAFAEHVVPIQRRRGIFRQDYRGSTLRGHLGLPRPEGLGTHGQTFAEAPGRCSRLLIEKLGRTVHCLYRSI